ncbi:MocR-like pyridoxine biosynthesis transcription factor PdxR [Paenibacillus senegalensis]|uniref:MocR-like pyridoxine biosynthesis transcription factor PdxR n=1 Tax=Paenibacillus senegalensis TaxID=1465766 RepID=UPI000288B97D|nr:PLP-dependent aminotransferase family protein [Paenibacillus senegalensis]
MPLIPRLDQQRTEPLFLQIYDYIKEEIRTGRLAPHTKLPSIRELAGQLNISRSPVEAAYRELLAEGYIESQPRRGLFVLDWQETGSQLLPSVLPSSAQRSAPPVPPAPCDGSNSPLRFIDFGFDHMATELFPYAVWRKLAISLLQPAHKELFHYGDPQGEIGLREQIAQWLRQTRGILCSPSQIIVTSGTQHSLIWLSWLLPESKGSLGVEEAIHDGIRKLWLRQGFVLTPIELDSEGISVEALSAANVNRVYVTPSHQFPYGIDMSLPRRRELLEWAKQKKGLILEDDYDHEFRFEGPPVHSLFSLSEEDNVIYIGTFSKALAPSLRMGYIVLPKHLLHNREQRFGSYDQPVSRLQQKNDGRVHETRTPR